MTSEELLVRTAINAWKLVVSRLEKAVASLTDEQLQRQVAPGKNRLYYLVGHLTALDDRLFPLLGLGERLHPELDEIFVNYPDRSQPGTLSTEALKSAFAEVHTRLTAAFEALAADEWLQRHTAVSEEDFAKDPLRNRLAVLLSRTGHISFHSGQMALAK